MIGELRDRVLSLAEPVLLIGNKVPDGDSCASLAALLSCLRARGRESYIHFVHPPSASLRWMFDPIDFCDSILKDYNSLIVVDDYVCSDRLGIPIKDDVEIINIDHHPRSDIAEGRSSFTGELAQGKWDTWLFWADVPATACLLLDGNITHPLLWVGLATDTKFFRIKNVTISGYVTQLQKSLIDSGPRLTDELTGKMLSKLAPVLSQEALDILINARIDFFKGRYSGSYIQVCIIQVASDSPEHVKSVLRVYENFSHVTAIINSLTLKVSLRSRSEVYPILNIAKSFNGGGHLHAAGCQLENLTSSFERLTEMLTQNLDDIETTLYF